MICDIKNNEANTPRYTHAPLINARANIPHKHTHTHKSLYGNKTPLTPQTHINRLIHLLRTRAPLPPLTTPTHQPPGRGTPPRQEMRLLTLPSSLLGGAFTHSIWRREGTPTFVAYGLSVCAKPRTNYPLLSELSILRTFSSQDYLFS